MENILSGLYDEFFFYFSIEKRSSLYKGKDDNILIIKCKWLKIKDYVFVFE